MLLLLAFISFVSSCILFSKAFYVKILGSSFRIPLRFYVYFLAILCCFCFLAAFSLSQDELQAILIFIFLYGGSFTFFAYKGFARMQRAVINFVDFIVRANFMLLAALATVVIVLIFLSIFQNSFAFLKEVGITNFLFKTNWHPESYEYDLANSFGIIPLVVNTLYITLFSLIVAFLFGLPVALYLSEYIKSRRRKFFFKSGFEIIAGVPSIFYGFFGAFILAPQLVSFGDLIGVEISMESIIVPGIAIGIMMTPYVATLLDDAFSSIPRTLKDATIAMGITRFEMIKHLILPVSLPDIVSTFIIVVARVLGETMVVLLTCGVVSIMTLNPLMPSTTITVQIVHLLTGDTSFDNIRTLSVFGLSLFLFLATMILNFISIRIKIKTKKL